MARIILCLGGAIAIPFGGYGLFVAWRDGDKPFHDAQRVARAIRHPIVLPVWAMKLLFYPSMAGMIVFGCISLSRGLGLW